MSAIVGRFETDGAPAQADALTGPMDKLSIFGPDGSDVEVCDRIALGKLFHQVSRHRPPDDKIESIGRYTVVADAILDNRDELISALGLTKSDGRAITDSGLIVRAFAKWGDDCNRYLLGDYAFAVFDAEKNELFLSRDHIGSRPLVWAQRGNTFLFSTSMRGLLGFGDWQWEIDTLSVAEFLRYYGFANPRKLYSGAQNVDPGSWLRVSPRGTTSQRWWHPKQSASVRFRSADAYYDHFRELTENAISVRCDTDLNVGSHISGGVDSSCIAAISARSLESENRKLSGLYTWAPAFSDAFPELGKLDERHMITRLAERIEAPVQFGTTTSADWLSYMQRPVEVEGYADVHQELEVLKAAETDKIGVMLSGWGGDEAFSAHGIGYIANLVKRGRFVAALNSVRALHNNRRNPKILGPTFWRLGIVPLMPEPVYRRYFDYADVRPNKGFAHPDILNALKSSNRGEYLDVRPVADPIDYQSQFILNGHIAERMETWADWGAQRNLQYRYPLTDRRVMEFALGLPFDMFIVDGESRYLSSRLARELLPGLAQKYDRANESLGSHFRPEAWASLKQQVRQGGFEADCPWLNMPAFRGQCASVPENWGTDGTIQSCELAETMRIWHLCRKLSQ